MFLVEQKKSSIQSIHNIHKTITFIKTADSLVAQGNVIKISNNILERSKYFFA